MSRRLRLCIPILVLMLAAGAAPPAAAQEDPPAQLFVEGLNAYKADDYPAAVERFESLVTGGLATGKLYYNLGNAYLKAGRLGHAVWGYEKALRLIPGDPDLRFNLAHARGLVQDQPEGETQPLARVLFFWRYQLRDDQLQWLALGFNLALWGALIVRRLAGRRPFRSWLLLLALPALLFAATAGYNRFEDRYRRQAIVLPDQLSVRAGRTPGATELFVLHAGTRVRIQAGQEGHLRIAFGRDKIGWVPAGDLGLL